MKITFLLPTVLFLLAMLSGSAIAKIKTEVVEYKDGETALEAFLVRLFLRRYVTYCARRRRFAAMNGAVRLFAEVAVPLDERLGKPLLSP